ncbi:DUF7146 domain-containing protein [Novosphingobium rosa]|uniref:DUF7146 domain-containing protein n=1 Tax=Novosphingobium rosa TaxID=76978 RepID=UPI00147145D3|nr:toprim domain-containing protein [Novosphingobium rosa]
MLTVADIAEKLNELAPQLAPELLPNGRYSDKRTRWMFSGIDDTGRSESAWVHLTGDKIGRWCDMGNARAGEERGDMIDLLRLKGGFRDQGAAVARAKEILGIEDTFKGRPRELTQVERQQLADEARARRESREAKAQQELIEEARKAKRLYLQGGPIERGPVEFYLRGRDITPGPARAWPRGLRFHPAIYCAATNDKRPAMLAPIYRADGMQIGTHRTYLDEVRGQWVKLGVEKPKKVLGKFWGGFIPIHKGASGKSMSQAAEGEPVYACEGIEDALVVRMMRPVFRIITTVSLGNIGAVLLPHTVRELVICADRDVKPAAMEALQRSISQQQARGLEVKHVMPPEGIKDFNDWWRAIRAAGEMAA